MARLLAEDRPKLQRALALWYRTLGSEACATVDALRHAGLELALRSLTPYPETANVVSVGRVIGKYAGVVVDGMCFELVRRARNGALLWRVRRVAAQPSQDQPVTQWPNVAAFDAEPEPRAYPTCQTPDCDEDATIGPDHRWCRDCDLERNLRRVTSESVRAGMANIGSAIPGHPNYRGPSLVELAERAPFPDGVPLAVPSYSTNPDGTLREAEECAPAPRAFQYVGDDVETCGLCRKHISQHYGGTEYRCDPKPEIAPPPSPGADPIADLQRMSRVEVVQVPEKLTEVQEHRLRRENSDLKSRIKALAEELSDAHALLDIKREVESMPPIDPIRPRERTSGLREGTVQVLASDWHVEEEVRPEQVSGRNVYNLAIAEQRMRRFFEGTRWGLEYNRQAFLVRDLIMWLGGDIITNYLHPDNVETNQLAPAEAILFAQTHIAAGIRHLLADDKLERIVVPCSDGNHGRLTQKMRSASRIESSIEIMLYRMLAREFAGEPRVKFVIATGEHLYLDVYEKIIRYTHGDSVRYGGGVGGITIPILKALARWNSRINADLTCMGHFHTRVNLNDLIVNGSLIGDSPYGVTIGAKYEPPSQDLTVFDPKRWKSISMPLWVSEIEDDAPQIDA